MAWSFEHRPESLGPFVYGCEVGQARLVVARLTEREIASIALALGPDRPPQLESMSELRQRTWLGGRAALALACSDLGAPSSWARTDDRGAPVPPAGIRGSIAHKVVHGEIVVAAIATRAAKASIGVDVELDRALDEGLSRRILTTNEEAEWPVRGDDARGRWLLARFSMKEAVYKAIDPTLRRYVGFREVELRAGTLGEDGLNHRVAWCGPEALRLDVRAGAERIELGPAHPCLVSVAIASSP